MSALHKPHSNRRPTSDFPKPLPSNSPEFGKLSNCQTVKLSNCQTVKTFKLSGAVVPDLGRGLGVQGFLLPVSIAIRCASVDTQSTERQEYSYHALLMPRSRTTICLMSSSTWTMRLDLAWLGPRLCSLLASLPLSDPIKVPQAKGMKGMLPGPIQGRLPKVGLGLLLALLETLPISVHDSTER